MSLECKGVSSHVSPVFQSSVSCASDGTDTILFLIIIQAALPACVNSHSHILRPEVYLYFTWPIHSTVLERIMCRHWRRAEATAAALLMCCFHYTACVITSSWGIGIMILNNLTISAVKIPIHSNTTLYRLQLLGENQQSAMFYIWKVIFPNLISYIA